MIWNIPLGQPWTERLRGLEPISYLPEAEGWVRGLFIMSFLDLRPRVMRRRGDGPRCLKIEGHHHRHMIRRLLPPAHVAVDLAARQPVSSLG